MRSPYAASALAGDVDVDGAPFVDVAARPLLLAWGERGERVEVVGAAAAPSGMPGELVPGAAAVVAAARRALAADTAPTSAWACGRMHNSGMPSARTAAGY